MCVCLCVCIGVCISVAHVKDIWYASPCSPASYRHESHTCVWSKIMLMFCILIYKIFKFDGNILCNAIVDRDIQINFLRLRNKSV